jgi:hypothetical protein
VGEQIFFAADKRFVFRSNAHFFAAVFAGVVDLAAAAAIKHAAALMVLRFWPTQSRHGGLE